MTVQEYTEYVKQGGSISRKQALELAQAPLEELCTAANALREQFCGNAFDICTIINAKSGKCSENCKFCAQSAHYHTGAEEYAMLDIASIVAQAQHDDLRGVLRYSLVTAGKRLTEKEVEQECESIRAVRAQTGIAVCVSNGLLNETAYRKLRDAGATRVHNNLETSRRYFPSVCTTHSYEEKCAAIRAAQAAGLSVCSGGIVGMGETMEDRIDMVLELRALGVRSIPVNMLNPVPGTPYEYLPKLTNDDMRRIVAIFRFLIPDASIRLAGGRGLLPDKGRACFCSGANAAISGDMLTTAGITVETDMALLKELGYVPQKCH